MTRDESRPFRAAPRARRSLRIRMFGQDATPADGLWAVTRDLSARGAFLRSETRFEPGARLRLVMEAGPGQAPVELEAEVRWCAPSDARDPGVGVEFVCPPPSVRRRLEEIQEQGALPVLEVFD